MKNIFIGFVAVLVVIAANAADLDYQGYLRTPLGTNAQGGKFISITNPGSFGNEFRIGNETPYGEASFTAKILKATKPSDSFFETNLMFAYAPGFSTQYGSTSATSDLSLTYLVQAFVRGGNVDGIMATYWAGKRFYRDADIHMDDLYYFADMSGVGAGVEAMPLSNGILSVAYLQYSDDTVTGTSAGTPTKQALDVRIADYSLDSADSLTFWFAQAYSAPGSGSVGIYSAMSGTAIGVKQRRKLEKGYNDLAVIYGNGNMRSLTLNADAYSLDSTSIASSARMRFVEHYSAEISANWGIEAAFVADNLSGPTSANWTSLGVRPVYYFTDHMHLVMQVGHSDVDGRTLERITVAPEVAIGRGFMQRPVIRFFVTENMWNDANKSLTAATSLVKQIHSVTTALDGRNDEFQMGFEGEVWF